MSQKKNYHIIRYGTAEGEIKFGHLHKDNVVSAVMLRSGFTYKHYITMDGDGGDKDALQDSMQFNNPSSPGPNKQALITAQIRQRRSSETNMISEEILLTFTLPHTKISEISTKHDVKIHELTSNKVVFTGSESKVLKATVEIKDVIY